MLREADLDLFGLQAIRDHAGQLCVIDTDANNLIEVPLKKKPVTALIRKKTNGLRRTQRPSMSVIKDIFEELKEQAEYVDDSTNVWYRVAPYRDGVELDIGDESQRRIRIGPGKVEIIEEGSDIIFRRTPSMLPFVTPAETGDWQLIERYLNLSDVDSLLLIAWITYMLANAKQRNTSFPILLLQGDQGSGKSVLCAIIQALTDPSRVGVQTFPSNEKDLAIAVQNAHVVFYDNMRQVNKVMSDRLCTVATGGALTGRQLYTDGEQHVHLLHGALVLNGIHTIATEQDLLQRCLPLTLKPIGTQDRQSEAQFTDNFNSDLPAIFSGLLEFISTILVHLPNIKPQDPERMYDFSAWLAAMETVRGVPPGTFQSAYSAALQEGVLEGLMDSPLAAAVFSFVEQNIPDQIGNAGWNGTPTCLLEELKNSVAKQTALSREWPKNPISLSIKLKSLAGGLLSHGIRVNFAKGRKRTITINKFGGSSHE